MNLHTPLNKRATYRFPRFGAQKIVEEVAQLVAASPQPSDALRQFDGLVWREVLELERLARASMMLQQSIAQ